VAPLDPERRVPVWRPGAGAVVAPAFASAAFPSPVPSARRDEVFGVEREDLANGRLVPETEVEAAFFSAGSAVEVEVTDSALFAKAAS
jgi:hypothetical protein